MIDHRLARPYHPVYLRGIRLRDPAGIAAVRVLIRMAVIRLMIVWWTMVVSYAVIGLFVPSPWFAPLILLPIFIPISYRIGRAGDWPDPDPPAWWVLRGTAVAVYRRDVS
jgi:hypothetical protein